MGKRRALGLLLCLLLLLCTACGGRTQNDTGDLHCTVTIECGTVLAHMDDLSPGKAELIPSDCGNLSGWMYSVNGVRPDYGCSSCTLHDGDTVVWSYTCDLGRDVGARQGEP